MVVKKIFFFCEYFFLPFIFPVWENRAAAATNVRLVFSRQGLQFQWLIMFHAFHPILLSGISLFADLRKALN